MKVVENDQFYTEQPKGRPRNQPTEHNNKKKANDHSLSNETKSNDGYLELDINLRIELELKYA